METNPSFCTSSLLLCVLLYLHFSVVVGMVKNRNKKKRNGPASMEISEPLVSDAPQAMDTTESGAQDPVSGASIRKLKKGRPMKRSQNVRKMKAIAKAMSKNEKTAEKVFKNDSKKNRVQSAKKLYD